jgi:hypothetical protein
LTDAKYRTSADQAIKKLTIWQTSSPSVCQYHQEFFGKKLVERSIKENKTSGFSKQKQHTTTGSGADQEVVEDTMEPEEIMMVEVTWMQPYLAYMLNKTLSEDVVEA